MKVIIVGGGIGGLAAATTLRRSGHTVHIYERSGFQKEVGAALTLGPNISRVLSALGVDRERAGLAIAGPGKILRGDTLDVITLGNPKVDELHGGPQLIAHRVDLHNELLRLATEEGLGTPAIIELRKPVERFDPDTPSVTLKDGTVVSGDLLVVADGFHSRAHEVVTGRLYPLAEVPKETYNICYRFLVPISEIEADPKTRSFVGDLRTTPGGLTIMQTQTKRLIGYPCRRNEIYNFALHSRNENAEISGKEVWVSTVDKSLLVEELASGGFHPQLIEIARKPTEVTRWPHLIRELLPSWTKGKMVLVGDAAHPMLPHMGGGASMAFEDAVALGMTMASATPDTIPERLRIFQSIRIKRAGVVQTISEAGSVSGLREHAIKRGLAIEDLQADDTIPAAMYWLLAYDVIQETLYQLQGNVGSNYKLPAGFFQNKPIRGPYPNHGIDIDTVTERDHRL